METVLGIGAARVFYDGLLAEPRLDHPEGLAVHRDGSIWCGGECGQIYRIEPDGSSMEQVVSTGGFSQGMAFDTGDNLYFCDLKHAAVMRLDTKSGALEKFADGADGRGIKISNHPAFDAEGRLYVSDSYAFKDPGPGIFRFGSDGKGELWYDEPINFANGLALSADGGYLYVAETFGNAVFRVSIEDDGSAGMREEVASLPGVLPDGLAFDTGGNLYVACYEPSQVLRVATDGTVARLIGDEEAHLFCHPTNLAFRGSTLFTTNLGRWHITAVDTAAEGLPLYGGYGGR
ncbi:MAG TPA: SMP-30/gluconolactonase/LRE family protein [Rubrobacter sp.]|jgi:gluconolactonase|nr:SMP-30/gluconolactonase/LRE family protein [Rubrobacter sp.]